MSSCRSGSKEKQSAKNEKKSNITQHKLEHNACQWETIVSVSVYTRVAKRVFFFLPYGRFFCQHYINTHPNKKLFHIFFLDFLSVCFCIYVMCVYVCVCMRVSV